MKSFVIGPYIYFFFRETAVENINCGKVRFSRVARICKVGFCFDCFGFIETLYALYCIHCINLE